MISEPFSRASRSRLPDSPTTGRPSRHSLDYVALPELTPCRYLDSSTCTNSTSPAWRGEDGDADLCARLQRALIQSAFNALYLIANGPPALFG
jgi:hypothetical protein